MHLKGNWILSPIFRFLLAIKNKSDMLWWKSRPWQNFNSGATNSEAGNISRNVNIRYSKVDEQEQKANSLLIMNYSSFQDSMGYLCIEDIVRLCPPRVRPLKRRSHNGLLDQVIGCEFSTSLKLTIKHRLLTQTLNTISNRTANPDGSFISQHFVCRRTFWLARVEKWYNTVSITVLG